MNNLELREILTKTLRDVVDGAVDANKANSIARLSSVILNSAIAEAKYNKEVGFFDTKALPPKRS